ncbi:MAG: hypothetical protein KDH96_05710 [Candidatus Riesia sp.]|nr:hypothetical protein [Candidatus Riesia sp.]
MDKRDKILALYESIDSDKAELKRLLEGLQDECSHPQIYETPMQKLNYMGYLDAARVCIVCSKHVTEGEELWNKWRKKKIEKQISREEYYKLRERLRPLTSTLVPEM